MSARFSFPQTPRSKVGEPIFFWSGEDWRFTGEGDVWVMPADYVQVKDPVVKILAVPKGGYRVFTRESVAFTIEDKTSVLEVTHHAHVYYVVSQPSVYNVWIGVKSWKVLAFLGYCPISATSILCTIVGGAMEYGAMFLNAKTEFEGEDWVSDMPGYSPVGHVRTEDPQKVKMGEMLKFAAAHKDADEIIRSTMSSKIYPPVVSPEVIRANAEELVKLSQDAVRRVISPNVEAQVSITTVEDGVIKQRWRHRSSLGEEFTGVAVVKRDLIDPFEAVRKKLNIKIGDPMPMPIHVEKVPVSRVIDWSVLTNTNAVARPSDDSEEDEAEKLL